jgi:Ras-related protein Rab-4B
VGALILYDVTSRESYQNLPTWLQDAREQAWKDISIIAVGNKRDRKEDRQVSFLEASRFAQDQEILFLETSALTGENVQDVFHTLAQRILHKVKEGLCDPAAPPTSSVSEFDSLRGGDHGRLGHHSLCRCGLPRAVTRCVGE